LLAAVLNAASTNERFSAVSGTFSISAKLLARLALPASAHLPHVDSSTFADDLGAAFDTVPTLLAPSEAASDPKDPTDQPRDLTGRTPINQNTGLKRRAIA
jgi:adenine-specific DNA-methyltransferase